MHPEKNHPGKTHPKKTLEINTPKNISKFICISFMNDLKCDIWPEIATKESRTWIFQVASQICVYIWTMT